VGADLHKLLEDVRAEQQEVRAIVETADLDAATPAAGWNVRDTVAHLAGTDREATIAATDPEAFLAALSAATKDIERFVATQLTALGELTAAQLLERWQSGFDRMLAAFATLPAGTKVPWYGPPMGPASFATARLMEYWAHGQDIADAVGVRRRPSDRLRHICHLGVRTRGFSYANRGRTPPDVPVAVELTAPDGSTWSFGDRGAAERVVGPAEDFCLLVTQRRHRDDTALRATGEHASEWLDIAQCFAGAPGPGRTPLTAR
jgi:uncharacterized protein (TIGR03084 family)